MWTTMKSDCFQRIVEHSITVYPEEACGVLLAQTGSSCITDSIAITNVHSRKTDAFTFDPEQWVQAFYSAKQQGLMIVGIYHSHPSTMAIPSTQDLNGWIDEQLLYAIVSLKQKDSPQMQFFQKTGKHQFASYSLSLA